MTAVAPAIAIPTFAEHLKSIEQRQERISGLTVTPWNRSAYLGHSLAPGDIWNLQDKWTALFVGKACDLACDFCPQPPKPNVGDDDDTVASVSTSFGFRDGLDGAVAAIRAAAENGNLRTVAFTGGEPLLYVDRIEAICSALSGLPLHLYMYTNGVTLDESLCRRLQACGLTEIRVDLAASNFSVKALRATSLAAKFFESVVVESPAHLGIAERVSDRIDVLSRTGIRQLNLCEMVINRHNAAYYEGQPYYIYNPYRSGGWASLPEGVDASQYDRKVLTASRHESYDVLDMASREGWPFTVHEISQGVHFKPTSPI